MDKEYLKKMYIDFLNESGYMPDVQENDIYFNHENIRIFIEIYGKDEEYGRMGHFFFMQHANNDLLVFTNHITTMVNRLHTFTKMYAYLNEHVNELNVVIAIPYFVNEFNYFKKHFDKMLKEIVNSFKTFDEIFNGHLDKYNNSLLPEETIFINGIEKPVTYSFSNNLCDIIKDINNKTGIRIDNISEQEWKLNQKLVQETKDLMQKYDVAYSMTINYFGRIIEIRIHHKIENEYYIYSGNNIGGKFHSDFERSRACKYFCVNGKS
jgi:hypothetical protein